MLDVTAIHWPRSVGPVTIAGRLAKKMAAVALVGAGLVLPGSTALAAHIERHDDPVMGCSLRLSGEITEGDAERLEVLISQRDAETLGEDLSGFWETYGSPVTRRLCLDSPGGSFPEGVRLARVILEKNMGTAIPAGATCDSACAIAFMAGNFFHPEGEFASPNRVLHPQGKLGFHAPRLVLEGRSYSAEETERAYAVALQTIAALVELRARAQYEFAESLFLAMLRTPPADMLRPQTVGDAARWGIALAPVGWNESQFNEAMLNVCVNAEAPANDATPDARDYWSARDTAQFLDFQPSEAFTLSARFNEGFGREAMGHCQIDLSLGEQVAGSIFGEPTGPFGFSRVEAMTGREHVSNWHVFQSHAPDTLIAALPAWNDSLNATLTRQIDQALQHAVNTGTFSCWLHADAARVVNVNEYVNLRRQPGFSTAIIRRVPLGERLQLGGSGNARGFGSASQRQNCQNACQSLERNPDDRAARGRAQQCVDDNVIWYEVIDARGNRGWISRRFLQQAG